MQVRKKKLTSFQDISSLISTEDPEINQLVLVPRRPVSPNVQPCFQASKFHRKQKFLYSKARKKDSQTQPKLVPHFSPQFFSEESKKFIKCLKRPQTSCQVRLKHNQSSDIQITKKFNQILEKQYEIVKKKPCKDVRHHLKKFQNPKTQQHIENGKNQIKKKGKKKLRESQTSLRQKVKLTQLSEINLSSYYDLPSADSNQQVKLVKEISLGQDNDQNLTLLRSVAIRCEALSKKIQCLKERRQETRLSQGGSNIWNQTIMELCLPNFKRRKRRLKYFFDSFQFFQKFKESSLENIVDQLVLKQFRPDQVICNYGEYGQQVFFVLEGLAQAFIKYSTTIIKDVEMRVVQFKAKEWLGELTLTRKQEREIEQTMSLQRQVGLKKIVINFLRKVIKYREGLRNEQFQEAVKSLQDNSYLVSLQCFLKQKNLTKLKFLESAKHQVKVVSHTKTVCAVLKRQFIQNCDLLEVKEIQELVSILQNMHFFQNFDLNNLMIFVNVFTQKRYKVNDVILHKGKALGCLYLIFKGTVELAQVYTQKRYKQQKKAYKSIINSNRAKQLGVKSQIFYEEFLSIYQYKKIKDIDSYIQYFKINVVKQVSEGSLLALEALLPEYQQAVCPVTMIAGSSVVLYEMSRQSFSYLPLAHKTSFVQYLRKCVQSEGISHLTSDFMQERQNCSEKVLEALNRKLSKTVRGCPFIF